LTGDETTDDFARLFDFGQTLESMRSKLLKEGFKEIKDHGQGIPKPFQLFFKKLGIPSHKLKNKMLKTKKATILTL
jgi:hypothetical protein